MEGTPPFPPAPTSAADQADGRAAAAPRPAAPRRIDSSALFGNDRLLEIAHAGAVYRLSLTALGKLILTK